MTPATLIAPCSATEFPVAVVGADIDPSLVTRLDAGTSVLVEVNGTRIYSHNPCPLVAEIPWEVVYNDFPKLGQRPNRNHRIVLSHPKVAQNLDLHYGNLLNLPKGQPAVFQEDDNGHPIYVTLQFISHYIPCDQVDATFEPWDAAAARLMMRDKEFKQDIMTGWGEALKSFKRPGWGQKSVHRFALRAWTKPCVVEALQNQDWSVLNKLDLQSLLRIHEAIHWLPKFLGQSNLNPKREVYDYES